MAKKEDDAPEPEDFRSPPNEVDPKKSKKKDKE